jgi:hypothetical protein
MPVSRSCQARPASSEKVPPVSQPAAGATGASVSDAGVVYNRTTTIEMCLDDRKGTSSHAATHASPATAPFAGGTRRGGLKREPFALIGLRIWWGSKNTTTASGDWRSKSAANMIGRHADIGITPDISGATRYTSNRISGLGVHAVGGCSDGEFAFCGVDTRRRFLSALRVSA